MPVPCVCLQVSVVPRLVACLRVDSLNHSFNIATVNLIKLTPAAIPHKKLSQLTFMPVSKPAVNIPKKKMLVFMIQPPLDAIITFFA